MRIERALLSFACVGVAACGAGVDSGGASGVADDSLVRIEPGTELPPWSNPSQDRTPWAVLSFQLPSTGSASALDAGTETSSTEAGADIDAGAAFTPCTSYRDCSGDTVCASDHVCRPACDCRACCPSGEACAGGVSSPPPGDAPAACVSPCASDSDCNDGQSCQGGFCSFAT